jgi:hypothetical protein
MVSPGLGSILRTNAAANRPGNQPRPHDRSGCRPRCPWQPRSRRRRPTLGSAAVSMERGEHRGGGLTASRADREEGRRCPDEHHLAVEGHTQSPRPERADCPLFSGAPKPDQTIDLEARPHLTIGSRTGVDCCVARRPPACGHLSWSDAETQPAQSGLITGGGADLLRDRRSAGTSNLDTARPDQSTSPATTSLKGDACRRSSLRAVSRLRQSRTRSRAGKASVRPASSPVRCCSASAATAARVR